MTWNHQKTSWKKSMGELWKKRMTCGCKLLVNIPFLPLIVIAKPSILIMPKFKPKIWLLDSWWYWISWLDIYEQICKIFVLWGYSPLIYSQTSNWKSDSEIYKCKRIKQVVSRWFKQLKKSVSWVCVVRPTSTYGAIRIVHSLVRSKSHQKQACNQNCTLAGAIKIAPKARVQAESHTRWCDWNHTKSVKPTSTYVPNDRKDSRQSHETP